MTGGHFPGQQGQQPGLVRYRTKHPEMVAGSRARNVMRYSGDFDMFTATRPRAVAQGGQARHQMNNVFRRAKSTEWDRDVLANNVQDLRMTSHQTLTGFHHLGLSSSNMQTLDKRISASTDQLDCIREHIREGGRAGGGRQWRPGGPGDKRHDRQAAQGRNDATDFYLGRSDNFLNKERGRKTPFEIFLEDDGPYSRKLYGPAPHNCDTQNAKAKSAQGDKVTTSSRNISSSKSTEYLDNAQDFVERDLRSISAIKKGLLWQQRDKLFSRWKERFFILTNDYFHCFKKGSFKVTEMGEFIFKVKLSSITSVSLLDKRGFLTICLTLGSIREGRIYLRRAEGLRDWFSLLKFNVDQKKTSRQPYSYLPETKMTGALAGGKKRYNDDEGPDNIIRDTPGQGAATTNVPKGINRLSLVTDLLMSEAVRYYTRDTRDSRDTRDTRDTRDIRARKETSEDSGVESGHSIENNGHDSQTDSGSEHSAQDRDASVDSIAPSRDKKEIVSDEKLLVCHL